MPLRRPLPLLISLAGCALVLASRVQADDDGKAARHVFRDAVAVWHLANGADSAGADSVLTPRGRVEWPVPLAGDDRAASLARGGDGVAARLSGGFLDAGQGAADELRLQGDQFTALIRLKITHPDLWATRGFFTKGGGHDRLVFNFFSHDFQQGPQLMRVGCEIGLEGRSGLGGQVMAHVDRIGFDAWHDLIARYDGAHFALFIDGVKLDEQPVQGVLRKGNDEPVAIGAGTDQGRSDNPFPGLVDHAAIWSRALTDAEIVTLSGGQSQVNSKSLAYSDYTPPTPETSTWELVQRARELQQRFQKDHHRPRYHFLIPEEGDIMPADPNGALWWNGRYHLFYIFQRFQSQEPTTVHCWGHASSPDLLHWEHHPTALDVAPGDSDRGIFSGNALISKSGTPTIVYHGVGVGNCIAEATDDLLIHWEKSPHNPIVPIPRPGDPGHGVYESWDPHAWIEGETCYAIFGGARPALFRGPQLTELEHVGPFLTNDAWSQPVEDFSCPDFFPLGDKHMLLGISHCRGARYFLGTWENEKFIAESHGRMNWPGGGCFAPETLVDPQGRRILWTWCMDERPPHVRQASGWSGVMSLPRVLSLEDGRLRIEPAAELERLRFNPRELFDITVPVGEELRVNEISGDSLELDVTIAPQTATRFGIKVRQTPDSVEETLIEVDTAAQVLRVDVSRSTLDPRIQYRTWCITRPSDPDDANLRVQVQEAPLPLEPGEPVRLRIFLDRSMLEVFANGRQCVTQRLWPTRADATCISLVAIDGPVLVHSLRAWDMSATRPQ